MPFKIVQTIERGKKFLSCVPDAWEDNGELLWPRKGSKKLQKNEDSRPGDDWISSPCTVKRRELTYEGAQTELQYMQQRSDTEDAESNINRRDVTSTININLDDLARQCILDKENILPVAQEQDVQSEELHQETEGQQALFWIEKPVGCEKSQFEESVLQRLENLEYGHSVILQKLSELGAQIEGFLRQAQQQKVTTAVGFEPIDTIQALQDFEESLKNKEEANSLKEKFMLVCGSGKGRGLNNSYSLAEVMFTRPFLNQCSWTGASRGATKKNCFKGYNRVFSFFFDIIHTSDKRFTITECEEFFKKILKNSKRRVVAKIQRASTTKARGKGRGKKSQAVPTPAVSSETTPNQNENMTEIETRDST